MTNKSTRIFIGTASGTAMLTGISLYTASRGMINEVKAGGSRTVEHATTIEFNDYTNWRIAFDDNKDGEPDHCNAEEMAATQEECREPYRLLGVGKKAETR